MPAFIRVFFVDDAWTTIPAAPDTSAKQLCAVICKKRNLHLQDEDHYSLYVSDSSNNNHFERRLEDEEIPLSIQETVKQQGQMEHFKFIFKINLAAHGGVDEGDESNSSSDEEMFSQVQTIQKTSAKTGYMEKRGKRKGSAWRERWFVLQDQKLFYFKTHEHAQSISFIPLRGAHVRVVVPQQLHQRKIAAKDMLLEIDTKERVYEIRARTQHDLYSWQSELKKQTGHNASMILLDDLQLLMANVEEVMANEDEKMYERFSDLEEILSNGFSLDACMLFCEAAHCEESLLFWCATEEYRLSEAQDRLAQAEDIHTRFLQNGADYQVSLPGKYVAHIKAALDCKNLTLDTFVAAQKSCLADMKRTFLRQFLDSKYFNSMILAGDLATPAILKLNPYRERLNVVDRANAASPQSTIPVPSMYFSLRMNDGGLAKFDTISEEAAYHTTPTSTSRETKAIDFQQQQQQQQQQEAAHDADERDPQRGSSLNDTDLSTAAMSPASTRRVAPKTIFDVDEDEEEGDEGELRSTSGAHIVDGLDLDDLGLEDLDAIL